MEKYKLSLEIISLSESNIWEIAKNEWKLNEVYFSDIPETCLCGHYPIKELCELKNVKNHRTATVGNCCVKKFIGLPSDKIFQAVKRIRKDDGKGLNKEAIEHAFSKRWINKWEYDFYLDTFRKRKLSVKQIAARKKINDKVLTRMNR